MDENEIRLTAKDLIKYPGDLKDSVAVVIRRLHREQKDAIRCHLIRKLTLEETATRCHSTKATVARNINRGLDEFARLFEMEHPGLFTSLYES